MGLPQGPNDIMPILRLSYQCLPPHLQPCFAYCSMFPKDWIFEPDKLVAMWISHAYIHTKTRENMILEYIGREYFDNFLSSSFFKTLRTRLMYKERSFAGKYWSPDTSARIGT